VGHPADFADKAHAAPPAKGLTGTPRRVRHLLYLYFYLYLVIIIFLNPLVHEWVT